MQRRRFARALAGCAAALVASGSIRADVLQWQGALAFELPTRPPLEITGGGVAVVNPGSPASALYEIQIDGGIAGTAIVPITDPVVTQGGAQALQAEVSLGSGTLGPFHPPVASTQTQLTRARLPVPGWLRLCLFEPDCQSGAFSLGLTAGSGEMGVGVGGLLTAGGGGPMRVSALAAPWTLKTASLPVETPEGASVSLQARGWLHGAVSLTGSTAGVGGALSVVTPIRVSSAEGQPLASFVRLTLHFVPEPRAACIAATGVLALLALRRRRIRRPDPEREAAPDGREP